MNSEQDEFLLAAPKLAGIQEGEVNGGKQTVRFVGVIGESLPQYSEVGFELTIKGVSLGGQSCKTVYQKINAMENGVLKEISASEFGGAYLYAVAVKNIPTDGTVFMEVTPYAKNIDGSITYTGITYSITYQNGVYLKSDRITNDQKNAEILVGAYNILHGVNYPQKLATGEVMIDINQVSDVIRDLQLDICGLNEVICAPKNQTYGNQAEKIAQALGYQSVFAKAINAYDGEYGNALVTKYPILSSKSIPIVVTEGECVEGQDGHENRVLLCADLLIHGQVVTVMVSHFGLCEAEIAQAISVVQTAVRSCTNRVILIGDFNLTPDMESYGQLCNSSLRDTASLLTGNICTFPSTAPHRKLDYLFLSGPCRAISAQIPDVGVSDHRPYVATICIR